MVVRSAITACRVCSLIGGELGSGRPVHLARSSASTRAMGSKYLLILSLASRGKYSNTCKSHAPQSRVGEEA